MSKNQYLKEYYATKKEKGHQSAIVSTWFLFYQEITLTNKKCLLNLISFGLFYRSNLFLLHQDKGFFVASSSFLDKFPYFLRYAQY